MKLDNVFHVLIGIIITIVGLDIFNIALNPFDWSSLILILTGAIGLCLGFSLIQLGFTGKSFLGIKDKGMN